MATKAVVDEETKEAESRKPLALNNLEKQGPLSEKITCRDNDIYVGVTPSREVKVYLRFKLCRYASHIRSITCERYLVPDLILTSPIKLTLNVVCVLFMLYSSGIRLFVEDFLIDFYVKMVSFCYFK